MDVHYNARYKITAAGHFFVFQPYGRLELKPVCLQRAVKKSANAVILSQHQPEPEDNRGQNPQRYPSQIFFDKSFYWRAITTH